MSEKCLRTPFRLEESEAVLPGLAGQVVRIAQQWNYNRSCFTEPEVYRSPLS